jgi:hypothetical protein
MILDELHSAVLDGATSPTGFLNPLEDATITLTITVREQDGHLVTSSSLTFGNKIWDNIPVDHFIRRINGLLLEGIYTLETSVDGTCVTAAPEGVNIDGDSCKALVYAVDMNLIHLRDALIERTRN